MAEKKAKTKWSSGEVWREAKPLLKNCDIVMFDVETTGLSAQNDRIIEFAGVHYHVDENFKFTEVDSFNTYINPERLIPEKITEITGITDATVADAPTESEIAEKIIEFCGNTTAIGYNIDFDVRFISAMRERVFGLKYQPVMIDCLKMARDSLCNEDLPNKKLGTVANFFGIEFDAHSAYQDIYATAKVVEYLVAGYLEAEAKLLEEHGITNAVTLAGTHRPPIHSVRFWEGFRGMNRIYVQTAEGSVYYDIRKESWGAKDANIDTIDMNYVQQTALSMTGCSNMDEFKRFKGFA